MCRVLQCGSVYLANIVAIDVIAGRLIWGEPTRSFDERNFHTLLVYAVDKGCPVLKR